MKFDTINIAQELKEYEFIIRYAQKRKITPFMYAMLKIATSSIPEKKQPFSVFIKNYLQIPDISFIKDEIEEMKDKKIIEVSYDLEEAKMDDFKILEKGMNTLKVGFLPIEEKEKLEIIIYNPFTKKKENSAKDKTDLQIISKETSFPENYIRKNISSYVELGSLDEIIELLPTKENSKYKQIKVNISLLGDELILDKDVDIEIKDNIKENYPIIKDDVLEIIDENYLKNIFLSGVDIAFYSYKEEFKDLYKAQPQKLRIIFDAPQNKEKFDEKNMSGVIWTTQKMGIENCLYLNSNRVNIFGANLELKYKNDKVIIFKYYKKEGFDYEDVLNRVQFNEPLMRLYFDKKENILEDLLKLDIKAMLKKLNLLIKFKNIPLEYKDKLEKYLENYKNIDEEIIKLLPKSFKNKSRVLVNLIGDLNEINFKEKLKIVKNNNLIFNPYLKKHFKQEFEKIKDKKEFKKLKKDKYLQADLERF